VAAHKVQAIDTVGAGDMYAGAFLYGLTKRMGAEKAAELASLASSRIVTHFGPRMNLEQVQSILEAFHGKGK
jgi:sugar/nucleoside kinase (ribokinase family)